MRGCVGGRPTTEDGSGGWARGANESTRLSQPNEPTQPDRYALHSIVCRDASGLYRLGLLPTCGFVAKRGGRTSTVRHSALASGVLLKHGNMQAIAVMRLAVCMCQCHTESGWSRSAAHASTPCGGGRTPPPLYPDRLLWTGICVWTGMCAAFGFARSPQMPFVLCNFAVRPVSS